MAAFFELSFFSSEMRVKMEEDRIRNEQGEIGTAKKGLHLAKLFRRKARKDGKGEKT